MGYVSGKLPRDEPYVLVGESFSGPLAIRLAAQLLPGLCGLVLVVTFARNPIRWLPRWFGPFIPPMTFRLFPTWSQLRLLSAGSTSRELKQLFQSALRKVAPRVFSRRVAELLRIDVTQELQQITVPMLILAGRRDRIVPVHNLRLLRQLRSDAQIEMINCGHLLLQTAPDQAAGYLTRFLEQIAK
jgi:pimeloyl-ACP methyl ester carboxylesterase